MFKWFLKNEKLNSKIKLSNNSSFVILIFAIMKFRNIGRCRFRRFQFWRSLLSLVQLLNMPACCTRTSIWHRIFHNFMPSTVFQDTEIELYFSLPVESHVENTVVSLGSHKRDAYLYYFMVLQPCTTITYIESIYYIDPCQICLFPPCPFNFLPNFLYH